MPTFKRRIFIIAAIALLMLAALLTLMLVRSLVSWPQPAGILTRIYVAALDGSQARPLTRGALDTQPSWSPDSRQIVFTRWISPFSALFRKEATCVA